MMQSDGLLCADCVDFMLVHRFGLSDCCASNQEASARVAVLVASAADAMQPCAGFELIMVLQRLRILKLQASQGYSSRVQRVLWFHRWPSTVRTAALLSKSCFDCHNAHTSLMLQPCLHLSQTRLRV